MKQILLERQDIVFFIKLLPLKRHRDAYRKAKAIVCEKSIWLLERALDGKSIGDARCKTTEVDDNIELSKKLGISGTPTIILPDGGIVTGYQEAEALVGMIEKATEAVRMAKEKELQEKATKDAYFSETGRYIPGDAVDEEAEGEIPGQSETGHTTDTSGDVPGNGYAGSEDKIEAAPSVPTEKESQVESPAEEASPSEDLPYSPAY